MGIMGERTEDENPLELSENSQTDQALQSFGEPS